MSAPPTRLFLVRHGETTWHEENRYAGADSDVDLTEHGRDQAAMLAGWAAYQQLAALAVSPIRRARETAAPVAEATGLVPVVHEGLREVAFGVAEGRTASEMQEQDPLMVRRFRDDPVAHPFPEAEPPDEAARRGATCLRELAARHPGGDVLVVAHNTLLRVALCELLSLPVRHYRRLFPRLENAALTEVHLEPDGRHASLVRLNAALSTPASAPYVDPAALPRPITEERS